MGVFLGRSQDCAGQPGCFCGASQDDCIKCVASRFAPGDPQGITQKCQDNCFQGGVGYCGNDLDNFCTCTGDAPPGPGPTPVPVPTPTPQGPSPTPSPGFIEGSGLTQCGKFPLPGFECYRVSNTCRTVLGLSYACQDQLLGDLAPKLANFCSQNRAKIAFGHRLRGMDCGDCALIRVQNDDGAPTPFQEVCMMAVDVGSGEVSDESLITGADALCRYNAQCRAAERVDYEWKPVDCASCVP